jgi:hypothetical protein
MALTKIRAEQIADLSIKSTQIATDAAIEESKLALNFPTFSVHDFTSLEDRKVVDYVQVNGTVVAGLGEINLTTLGILLNTMPSIASGDTTTEGVFLAANANSKTIILDSVTHEPIIDTDNTIVYGRTNFLTSGTSATATVTVQGPVSDGQSLSIILNGGYIQYTTQPGDTLATIATALAATVTSGNALGVTATSTGAVITLTSPVGTVGNYSLSTDNGPSGTASLLASGNLTGGTGGSGWVMGFFTMKGATETPFAFASGYPNTIDWQYLERFNLYTVSELFAANEKFVWGAADVSAELNILQLAKDLFTTPYTLNRNGAMTLGAPLQTTMNNFITLIEGSTGSANVGFTSTTTGLTSATTVKTAIEALASSISGASSALQGEVDAIENSVGLNTDGSIIPWFGTNYMDAATTIAQGMGSLDTALKAEVTARATAITAEAATRAAADTAEATTRTTADTTLQTNIDNETTARTAADTTLQNDIAAEATARTTADTALQTELDTVEASVGLNSNGALNWTGTLNFFVNSDTLSAAIVKIDNEIKAHEVASVGAHTASAISFAPAGTNYNTTTITVQDALVEISQDLASHIAETVDAHMASSIGYTNGALSGVADVKGALDTLTTLKHGHHFDESIATGGETVITVPSTYVMGNGSLQVSLNGQGQRSGSGNSYTETTTTTFTFADALVAGDWVEFEWIAAT